MGLLSKRENIDTSEVQEKHDELVGINKTVTEYAALLEQVSKDRADLLLEISKLQIQNAELGVSKALFEPLQQELEELREEVAEFECIVNEARTLKKELGACQRLLSDKEDQIELLRKSHTDEVSQYKKELATSKGQITRLQNKLHANKDERIASTKEENNE